MTEKEVYQTIKVYYNKSGNQFVLANLFLDSNFPINYELDICKNKISFYHSYSKDVFNVHKNIVIKTICDQLDVINTLVKKGIIQFSTLATQSATLQILPCQKAGVDKSSPEVIMPAFDDDHLAMLKKYAFRQISSVK